MGSVYSSLRSYYLRCLNIHHKPVEKPRSSDLKPLEFTVNPENSFAIRLLRSLIQPSDLLEKNILVSPCHVEVILAALLPRIDGDIRDLLTELLCPNGRSYEEFLKTLDDAVLEGLNIVFYDDTYSMVDHSAGQYIAQVEFMKAAFHSNPEEAANIINRIISSKISANANQFSPVVTSDASLILVSIVQVSGKWESPFRTGDTQTGTFYGLNKKETQVPLMKYESCWVRTYNVPGTGGCHKAAGHPHMVIMDLAGGTYCVMIILPSVDEEISQIMDKFQQILTIETLLKWREKAYGNDVDIVVPKFRLRHTTDLKSCMEVMGLDGLFTPSVSTFRPMSGEEEVNVQEFRQEIIIGLDEYGLNASPFSQPRYVPGLPLTNPNFVVNRPFLLIVWDEYNNIPVIIGQITDPISM
ncbi:alpha-1-antitrypsin homolog [Paramacrobiotus metropolitanus]|uniref:alpha-1-antitrypsin homolog n=1 Tax=Paramacrobiotus metropolitanus TaxID=2943436 RepID=UPI0024462EC3|nr:alpha-1-antitrypsin homolog [Paramacrobiotus metropolitanus]